MDRKLVSRVVCLQCKVEQDVTKLCESCGCEFGKYYCEVCRLFDNKDRQQFHCQQCGLCRVGGRENFFHCEKCDLCLSIGLKDNHKCVEKVSHDVCPVCMEDLHTSRAQMTIPPCGHILHRQCFQQCLRKGHYACPTCNQSMVDMDNVWKDMDEEMKDVDMPEEYRDLDVVITCRDCHKESTTKFHVLGLKCQLCGSYNTAR
ncbi:RING finger and CHY zinc finger domain-containing protein 1-like isoform X2 [Littorina saxatilis]